jgi:myo-inositol 2-dehydrogenase / D-chiro-inositol 1-dehydrogenase
MARHDTTRQAAYGYDQRVEVFGSKGMIQSENLRPNQCTISTGESVHQDLPFNFFMDRYTEVGTLSQPASHLISQSIS